MKNLKLLASLFVLLGIITVAGVSCQIGLGAAVDTETPKIEFDSSLPDNAIIRGKFSVGGTWSDDGEIHVNVSLLESIDGVDKEIAKWEKVDSPRTKTEAGKNSGTWSCTIDPFDATQALHDSGNYKIELLIKDRYGHSSKNTKSITIDNTPPVLVITRPTNAVGESGFDSYGQEFIISGYIGDSCDKRDLKVEIFDAADSETPLYSKIQKDINSTDFSFTVAVKDSEDAELKNAYDAIYGSAEGTKNLYCKISAYDKAMVYGEESDGMGNCAGYYYLYNALYSEVFQNYGVSDIYEMNRNARQADSSVLETLENNKIEIGQFSINPNNNPSFKISGKDPLNKDGTDFSEGNETYHITNGTAIVAEIEPGLDQTPLYGDSLGVYAIEWDDVNQKEKDGAEKIALIEPLKVLQDNNYIDNPKIADVAKEKSERTEKGLYTNSGTTYKLKTTLLHSATGIQIGKKYIFGIYGYDQKGVAVKNAKDTYGFLLSTNVAPTVKINSPAEVTPYLREGQSLTVGGIATTEVGKPDIYIKVNGTEIVKLEASTLTATPVGGSATKIETAYSYTIPATLFSEAKASDGTEEFTLEVKALYCEMPATAEKTVLYDTEAPVIDITSPGEGEWLHSIGDVEVSGKVSDNLGAVDNVYYSISTKDITAPGWTKLTFSGVSFKQKLVTTTAEGKATAFVAFYAEDKAGNKTDVLVREINVDTANPVLSGLKYESGESFTEAAVSASSGTSTPLASDTYVIGGSYSDTGTSVSVTATRDGEAVAVTQTGTKTGTWQIAEKEVAEGSHEYEIAATDESGRKVTNKITINADKSAPSINLPEGPGSEDTKASSYTFSGTSNDGDKGSGVDTVTVTITDATDSTKTHTETTSGTTNWSLKVEYESDAWKNVFATEGQKNIVLTATDKAGNVKTDSTNQFVYDKNDPVLTVTAGATQQYMTSAGFNFAGTASDTLQLGSLKLTEKIWTVSGGSGSWIETEASRNASAVTITNGAWTAKVPLGNAAPTDGRYQYQFVLSDGVGHESRSPIYTTTVDTTAPVLSITTPAPSANYATDKKSVKMGTAAVNETTFRFAGNLTEANEVKGVYYKILESSLATNPSAVTDVLNASAWTSAGWTAAEFGTANFNFTKDFKSGTTSTETELGEGNKKLCVYAVDSAGNVSDLVTSLFDVDMGYPDIEVAINYLNKANSNAMGSGCIKSGDKYYFNEDISGTVKATDSLGLPSISVAIKAGLNSDSKRIPITPTYDTPDENGFIPWTIDKSLFTNSDEVQLKDVEVVLEFTAIDSMQKTTTQSIIVMRDETAPLITFEYPADKKDDGNGHLIDNIENINAPTLSANGKITENGIGIGDNQIFFTTDAEINSNTTWTAISYSGGNSWSQNLTIPAEGQVTLTLKTADKLGNEVESINYPKVRFNYDKANPVLTVDTLNQYQNGNFVISGKASDSNNISRVEVVDDTTGRKFTYKFTDEQKAELKSNRDGSLTPQSWSLAFKVGTDTSNDSNFDADGNIVVAGGTHTNHLSEGSHAFTVNLYDAAERVSSKAVTVTVDTVPPVLGDIPVPDINETENATYKFIGEVEDATTNVTEVWVAFTAPSADGTNPNAVKASGTWSYNCVFANVTETDSNGKKIFETSGQKTVYVRAKDKAGNWSGWKTKNFNFDKRAPNAVISTFAEQENSSSYGNHQAISGNLFGTSKLFQLKGSFDDDWGFDLSESGSFKITQKKDNGDEVDLTDQIKDTNDTDQIVKDAAVTNGERYTWTLSGLPRDPNSNANSLSLENLTGTYEYAITVVDKTKGAKDTGNNLIEKTKTHRVSCVIDVSAPEVSFTTPKTSLDKKDYISDNTYTFYGKAKDVGTAGVKNIYYQFVKAANESSTPTPVDTNWIIMTDDRGEKFTDGNWSIDKTIETGTSVLTTGNLCEGKWFFFVYAEDNSGNVSGTQSISFWVDKAAPVISETKVGTTGKVTNTAITLSGTVTETHELTSLIITDNKNQNSSWNVTLSSPWTVEIPLGSENNKLADGTHTLTITATDVVGRTHKIERTVTVDTNLPTVGEIVTPLGKDFDGATVSFSGKINDTEPSSGINVVKVWFTNGTDSTATNYKKSDEFTASGRENWTLDLTKTTLETLSELKNVFVEEGKKYVYVEATDNAGNTTTSASPVEFIYDKTAPSLGDITAPAYSNVAVTLSMTATDNNGIRSVVISEDDNEFSSWTAAETQADSGTYTYTIPLTSDVVTKENNKLRNGEHNFTVVATDNAGRTAKKTCRVVVDTVNPTIGTPGFSASPMYLDVTSYNTLSVTASDATSGLDSVYYQLVISNAVPASDDANWESLNRGSGNKWTATIDLSNKTDGTYYAFVKAVDATGNETLTENSNGTAVVIDQYKPVTEIVDAASTAKNENISFNVKVTDTNPTEPTVTITQPSGGASVTASVSAGTNTSAQGTEKAYTTYTVTVPLTKVAGADGNDTLADGTYTVTINEIDDHNRVADTVTHTILRDTAEPVITIDTVTTKYNKATSYKFSGTITEANPVSAVATLYKKGVTESVSTHIITLENEKSNAQDWEWTPENLEDGEYYVSVTVKDKGGNEVTESSESDLIVIDNTSPVITSTTSDSGTVYVYTEVTRDGYTISGTVSDASGALDETTAIEIKVDDAGGTTITEAVINSEAAGHVKGSWSYTIPKGSSNGKLKSDATVAVTVKAKDRAGNTASKTYYLFYDTQNPALEITSPVLDEQVETNTKIIKGTVSDEGYGLKGLSFVLKDAAGNVVKDASNKEISGYWPVVSGATDNNYPLTVKGESWYYAGADGKASAVSIGTKQGALSLEVTATENTISGTGASRTGETTTSVDFYYDEALPNISETNAGTTGLITNGTKDKKGTYDSSVAGSKKGFVFEGKAWDTNELDYIYITDGTHEWYSKANVKQNNTADISLTKSTTEPALNNWSMAFEIGEENKLSNGLTNEKYLADGTYDFTIYVYDISGKSRQLSRTVIVDTVAPEFKNNVTSGGATTVYTGIYSTGVKVGSETWYNKSSISVKASVNVDNGSELSSIEISKDNTDWIPLNFRKTGSGSNTIYTGTTDINYSDGNDLNLYIRATDMAGNVTSRTPVLLKVDTTAPELPKIISMDGSTIIPEEKLVNGTNEVVLVIEAKDEGTAGSGIQKVEYTRLGATTFTTPLQAVRDEDDETKWILTIPANTENSTKYIEKGAVKITVTDNVGKTSVDTLFSFDYDGTPPEVTIDALRNDGNISGRTDINRTVVISGTAKDGKALLTPTSTKKPVVVQYYYDVKQDGSKPTADWSSSNKKIVTPELTPANPDETDVALWDYSTWSFELDTNAVAANNKNYLFIRATAEDSAKNTFTTNDYVVYVNQETDIPVIKIEDTHFDVTGDEDIVIDSKKIDVLVEDDDGTIQGLWWTTDETTAVTKPSSGRSMAGWTAVTGTNGSYKVVLPKDEADLKLYFYLVDATGAEFIYKGSEIVTASSTTARAPYIIYGTPSTENVKAFHNATSVNSHVFSIDTAAPKIADLWLSKAETWSATDTIEAYNAAATTQWSDLNGQIFGGNQRYLFAKVKVHENTGMKSSKPVKLEIKNIDGTSVKEITTATKSAEPYLDAVSGKQYFEYIVGPIDVKETRTVGSGASQTDVNIYPNDSLTLLVTVYDIANGDGDKSMNIAVDNEAPKIDIKYPVMDVTNAITSTVTMKGTLDDGKGAGIEKLEYKMTADANTAWTLVTRSTSWEIPFTSTERTSEESILYYANDTYATETALDSAIWKVPVYFRVTDKLGNITEDALSKENPTHFIYVDAEGGIPKSSISSPEPNASIGGSVTIIGTASDDIAVKDVRIQLDVNNDGNFTEADYSAIEAWNNEALKLHASSSSGANDWYIEAEGTNSWKLMITTDQLPAIRKYYATEPEAWPKGYFTNEGLTTSAPDTFTAGYYYISPNLGMRVTASDDDGQLRPFAEERWVKVDKGAPSFGKLKLVVYQSGNSGAYKIEREYSEGMFISNKLGNWYLVGEVTDDTWAKSLSYSNLDISAQNRIPVEVANPLEAGTLEGTKTININMPLPVDNDGEIYIRMTAIDGDTKSGLQDIRISIDNTAPKIYKADGTQTTEETTDLRVMDKSGKILGTTSSTTKAMIANSDGIFTLKDSIEESGSKVHYVAFYFKRTASDESNPRTYNPMGTKSAHAEVRNNLSETVYVNDEKLVVKKYTDSTSGDNRSALDSFTSTGISTDENIRVGGLIKIGGAYSRITAVNGNTIKFAPTIDTKYKDAEFVYAQIIDHALTESSTNNDFNRVQNDDGDGMVESLTSSGSKYDWEASIFSNRIPDGPIELHIVAFDYAGNSVHGSVNTYISNNRPRISKVLLGTDLNGNGKIDFNGNKAIKNKNETNSTADGTSFGEFVYYSTLDSGNNAQSQIKLASSDFIVKKDMLVIPEFVGGNGNLGYVMNVADDSDAEGEKATGAVTGLTTKATLTDATNPIVADTSAENPTKIADQIDVKGAIYLTKSTVSGYESVSWDSTRKQVVESVKNFAFTIWDTTEETVQGQDSQWALLEVPVKVDVTDDRPPAAFIRPFYWYGNEDNSILIDTNTQKLAGHIELEKDLTFEGSTFTETSGVLDKDPKVSGQIRIEGYAYDESKLNKLNVGITGFKLNEGTAGDLTTLATFGATGWTYAKADANVATDGWKFTVEDTNGVTGDGHLVKWILELDTSRVLDDSGNRAYAGLDKIIQVQVTDGTNNSASSTAQTGTTEELTPTTEAGTSKERVDVGVFAIDGTGKVKVTTGNGTTRSTVEIPCTPYYKMDIVPYISSVKTMLNKYKSNNPSVYSRTALGHYPVRAAVKNSNKLNDSSNEIVEITGFNLAGGAATVDVNTADLPSGNYVVSTNGIDSLNNINNNDADYNSQGNGDNNDALKDDVIFDVWEINDRAAVGIGGSIKSPAMNINPSNGQVGFAFASEKYFSMPDADNSFNYWTASGGSLNSPTFAYMNVNNTVSTMGAISGSMIVEDTPNNIHNADHLMMYMSKIGSGQKTSTGTMSGIGGYRLEKMGYKVNDTSYSSNQNRIQSLSFAINGNKLYMAYYDSLTNQIRFKAGAVPDGSLQKFDDGVNIGVNSGNVDAQSYQITATGIRTYWEAATAGSQEIVFKKTYLRRNEEYISPFISGKYLEINGHKYQIESSVAISRFETASVNEGSKRTVTDTIRLATPLAAGDGFTAINYSNNTTSSLWKVYSLLPVNFGSFVDQYSDETMVGDITDNIQSIDTTTTTSGKYVSMDVVPSSGNLVAVWYDQTNHNLMYSYNATPNSLNGTTPNGDWSTNTKVLRSNAGEYCKVKADADGGIHITCFEYGTGDILYLYMPSVDGIPVESVVDTDEVKSFNLSLDVVKPSADAQPVPYISWYCAAIAQPRMAYLANTNLYNARTVTDGMVNGKYTGNWEITVIPTVNDVQRDNVNVALWKDSGVQKVSDRGTSTWTHIEDAEKSSSYGVVYGNGTVNPVMGYVTSDGTKGYIETAQMR